MMTEKKMILENIECLIDGEGTITFGRVGSIRCAAIACDSSDQLAALVLHPGESFVELLSRLDAAIAQAWEEECYTDEINR